jgi:CheY-like chemotaxis protein
LPGQKCALIVDDSRSAREVLRKLLATHQLRVETAESAEAALDYLSTARPDVIFMDHMMPGMDGFQAVRAIKNNPATATIPIMMYTSQEGELYVGQARALGAVGVLPKQIKPVEVTEILQSLHLIPTAGEAEQPVRHRAGTGTAAESGVGERTLAEVSQKMDVADWSELHDWLAEMLAHHSQSLKQDLESSMRRLFVEEGAHFPERRRNVEDRRQGPGDRRQAQAAQPAPEPAAPESAEAASPPRLATTLAIGGLALLVVILLGLQLDARRQLRDITTRNTELAASLDWQRSDRTRSPAPAAMEAAPGADARYLEFLAALQWTANQGGTFEPGDVPLGDARVDWLDGLLTRLQSMDFSGVVQVDTHLGEFCQVTDSMGNFVLAPDDLPALDCQRTRLDAEEALRLSSRQSVRFANYLFGLQTDPMNTIRVQINALGGASPAVPYPPGRTGVLAGEWNRIDNRIQVALIPD